MEGRREAVKAKILAENKVHVWKVHFCSLLTFLEDPNLLKQGGQAVFPKGP